MQYTDLVHSQTNKMYTYQGLNGSRLTHSQSTLDGRRRDNFNFRGISIVCGGKEGGTLGHIYNIYIYISPYVSQFNARSIGIVTSL